MWQLFHAYRRLADAGKVKHLTCPDCDTVLATTLSLDDPTDSVWLWCPTCNSRTAPGLDLLSRVRAVVLEHTS